MADKLTPAMRAVLENMDAGRVATYHLRGRSAMGGYERTRIALLKRGLIRHALGIDTITEAGRAALNQPTGR